MNEIKECMILLKTYAYKLNKQQFKTFKGQILKGEYNAFRTGLFRLMLKNMKGVN